MAKLVITESQFSVIKELILNETAYPEEFDLKIFDQINSFAGRIRYCENRLKRISQGTGRIVYFIDNDKVLKLAKNRKGIEQNRNEILITRGCDIVAKVLNTDMGEGLWIESEYARRATAQDFKRLLGYNFTFVKEFVNLCRNQYSKYPWNKWNPTPEQEEFFEAMMDDSFPSAWWFRELYDYLTYSQLEAIGDLLRPSTWGVVKRNGEELIVLVDYGLTDETYKYYYER